MTPDEQAIVDLTREVAALKTKIADMERENLSAEIAMSEIDVPTGFEDGNDWDDYGHAERVRVLCRMYSRADKERRHYLALATAR